MHGPPLELGPEEVTLALSEGWGRAVGPAGGDALARETKQETKKRKWAGDYGDDDEDLSDYSDGAYGYGGVDDEEEASKPKLAPWQAALADGSFFTVPTLAQEAREVQNPPETAPPPPPPGACASVEWSYPETPAERRRMAVFKDLHARGYSLTGGSKFGSDFMLYPGDPTLFHAQFCVRIAEWGVPLLPAMLAASCRGSFQARKHLLLASVEEGEEGGGSGDGKVRYMTFGPVDGFG